MDPPAAPSDPYYAAEVPPVGASAAGVPAYGGAMGVGGGGGVSGGYTAPSMGYARAKPSAPKEPAAGTGDVGITLAPEAYVAPVPRVDPADAPAPLVVRGDDRRGSLAALRAQMRKPDWGSGKWCCWYFTFFFQCCVFGAVLVVACIFTNIFDHKEVQAVCTDPDDMARNLCILSAGQFATGIITVGQITIGFINISQIGIGVLFSVGQGAASLGYVPAGQIVFSSFTHFAQIGFAMYRIQYAQLGLQLLYPWIDRDADMFVACGRRQRR